MEQTQKPLENQPIPAPSAGGFNTEYPRTVGDELAEMHSEQDIVSMAVHGVDRAITNNQDPRPKHTHNRTPEDTVAEFKAALATDDQWAKFGPEKTLR
jgi:hypothetical protein